MTTNYKISTIQFNQTTKILEDVKQNMFHDSPYNIWRVFNQLAKYYRFHRQYLLSTFDINKIFGKFLLMSLMINTPLNAYLIMSLLNRPFNIWIFSGITCGIIFQIIFIFILHLNALNYSRKIHASSKLLHSISTRIKLNNCFVKEKLDLSNYFVKIHTDTKYGITYGPMSLVTFKTFSRVNLCTKRNNSISNRTANNFRGFVEINICGLFLYRRS